MHNLLIKAARLKQMMQVKNWAKAFLLMAAMASLGACRVSEKPVYLKAPAMPQAYASTGSGGQAALPSWRKYYADERLAELVDSALAYNFDMRRAMQRLEIARADVLSTTGALLPSVGLAASAGIDRYGRYTLNGVGNDDTNLSPNISGQRRIPTSPTPDFFVGLRASWEIDIWGRLRSRRRAALYRYMASTEAQNAVVTSLVADVANAYFDLISQQNQLGIIRRNKALQERATQIVQIQKNAGRATELAVQQFKAQLLRTQSLEFEKLQDITVVENRLHMLTGRYAGSLNVDGNLLALKPDTTLQAGVPTQLLQRRPDIRQALNQLNASEAEVNAAKASFYPNLVITPYLGYNAFRAALLFDPSSLAWGVLGSTTTPFFNRRGIRANYNAARAENQSGWLDYQQSMVNAYQEVVVNQQMITNYERVVNLTLQEVQTLQAAVNTADLLYRNGYATYLEVITAQRSVLDAELDLIEAKRRELSARVGLYRALGGGWGAE